jgi:hypothetical protein
MCVQGGCTVEGEVQAIASPECNPQIGHGSGDCHVAAAEKEVQRLWCKKLCYFYRKSVKLMAGDMTLQ